MFHARTKQIEIEYHFVREEVANGTLITCFVSATDQLADIFTKALSKTPFTKIHLKLGVDDTT